jgi:integrase/recombinase XerD
MKRFGFSANPQPEDHPMTGTTATDRPLRRRLVDDMSLRNLPLAPQRSYIHAVKRFARFNGQSPDQLELEDVHTY